MGRRKGLGGPAEGGEAGGAGVVLVAPDGEAEAKEEEELPLERVELAQLQSRDLRPVSGGGSGEHQLKAGLIRKFERCSPPLVGIKWFIQEFGRHHHRHGQKALQ